MPTYLTPGVYKEDVFLEPAAALRTGVPVFLGYTTQVPTDQAGRALFNTPQLLTLWPQFGETFGASPAGGYLAQAVYGFFQNGGELCYVVPLAADVDPDVALTAGLQAIASLTDIDLVCAPDAMRPDASGAAPSAGDLLAMQAAILDHCDVQGDRFAILDAPQGAGVTTMQQWPAQLRQQGGSGGANGALYFPWIQVEASAAGAGGFVPPCGHVAGIYARTDRRTGVHKAPANEVLAGVLDLSLPLGNADQDLLNPVGVNCLRAFPGRGIRVWGARTLATGADDNWMYVSVRRLFLTAGRWIELNLADAAFEPHDYRLWARISRDLTAYFTDLFRQGALKGASPGEAFYVKCDAETNPTEVRDAGKVVTEIGLAAAAPGEFIVVRIIHDDSGMTISGGQVAAPAGGFVAPALRARVSAGPDVQVIYVEYNPVGHDIAGEFVLIQNRGGAPASMTGWTLSDRAGHTYTFPAFTLGPRGSVRVWVKAGENTARDLFWGRTTPVWNNVGDIATLRAADGTLVNVFPPRDRD